MTTRLRRASAATAVVAALMLGSWNLASATSLHVDGGILQSWEIEADLPAAEPAIAPQPDAAPSETGEAQDLAAPNAPAGPTTLPAPNAPPVSEPTVSEPAASEPAASEPQADPITPEAEPATPEAEPATPVDPSPAPEPEPIADPPVPAP